MQRQILLLVAAVLLGACGGDAPPASGDSAAVGLPVAEYDEPAPNQFRVLFETSKGDFVVEAYRDWAPRGVDRFYHLVRSRYFDDVRFFRVVSSFMVQFGMHGDPRVHAVWDRRRIVDDSVRQSNRRGYVSFATSGADTRTTQLFINTVNNRPLDEMGFAPIGRVVEGLDVVDSLYSGYGDAAPAGVGPDQTRIRAEGNAYLEREFSRLDFIRRARIIGDSVGSAPARDTGAR